MLKAVAITIFFGILVLGYWFVRFSYNGKNNTDKIFTDPAFIITVVLFFCVLAIVIIVNSISRLVTKVENDCIYIHYYPFKKVWEKIDASDIFSYRLKTYRAYREYGGYGVRDSRRRGKAYIISGETGLQLYLKNGTQILIGTQKKQAIKYAIDKVMKGKKTA